MIQSIRERERLYLWTKEDYPGKDVSIGQDAPSVIPFLLGKGDRKPAMLICPGGGFMYKEMVKEGEQTAYQFNQMGMHAFVLDYRVLPYRYPCQLMDVQRAVRLIRRNADQFFVDPGRVCIAGFSAGATLAGLAAVADEQNPGYRADAWDETDGFSARPDAVCLAYPVGNAMGELNVCGDMVNALIEGARDREQAKRSLSITEQICERTPPMFCWATSTDQSVPSVQSLEIMEKLLKYRVRCELHIFEEGPHGMALSRENGAVRQWITALSSWLLELGISVRAPKEVWDGFYEGDR